MTNHYNTIIIGAGQSDLSPSPSPEGEGNVYRENKKPPFSQRLTRLQLVNFQFH
jgi:hypothetical protein